MSENLSKRERLAMYIQKIYVNDLTVSVLTGILHGIENGFKALYKALLRAHSHMPPIEPHIRKLYKKLPLRVRHKTDPMIQTARHMFAMKSVQGHLSLPIIMKISVKNLIHRPSRSIITIGAIAVGTGAIVFLMSFGYGLQSIVNDRLVQKYSMRLTDVQSDSTALTLTEDSVDDIRNIAGVEDIAAAVSLAGSFSFNDSKMDVIVIAASNKFLEYSHIEPLSGVLFSDDAEKSFVDKTSQVEELVELLQEQTNDVDVLGEAMLNESKEYGTLIDERAVRYRVKQDLYIPVRERPSVDSAVLGFTRGTVLQSFQGYQVWGGPYSSIDTSGRYYKDSSGAWYGKWIRTSAPLFKESMPAFYEPLTDEGGAQLSTEGYIALVDVHVLSEREIITDRQVEELLGDDSDAESDQDSVDSLITEDGEDVLGEATDSATATSTGSSDASSTTDFDDTATVALESGEASEEAVLKKILKDESEEKKASREAEIGFVTVSKQGGKEIIISSKILKTLELSEGDVLGKNISLEYIVSGGIIPGVSGRIVTKPVTYKVVGIVEDDKQTLVFTPIADVASMGVKKYAQAKVLASDSDKLMGVREKIESMGFVTRSLVDTLAQVNKLFTVMKFLLGAFGIIALVVAIFGMFNTLTVSLLERTREVGVMKTLGTTDFDVLRLFMVESLLIGILGGLLGISIGIAGGFVINMVVRIFQQGATVNLFVAPLPFIIFIFMLSVLVGFLTGLYPSRRAQKISALNALRYE